MKKNSLCFNYRASLLVLKLSTFGVSFERRELLFQRHDITDHRLCLFI